MGGSSPFRRAAASSWGAFCETPISVLQSLARRGTGADGIGGTLSRGGHITNGLGHLPSTPSNASNPRTLGEVKRPPMRPPFRLTRPLRSVMTVGGDQQPAPSPTRTTATSARQGLVSHEPLD